MRQIAAVLINAPAVIRDRYRDVSATKLVTALVHTRPAQLAEPDHALTLLALRSLARRHRILAEEITSLEQAMRVRWRVATRVCWPSRASARSSVRNC
jgi:transposase